MKIIGSVCKQIIMVIIAGIIGFLLMILAFCIPTDKIIENVGDSIGILERETDFYSVTDYYIGSRIDNYTDSMYLNEALVGSDVGILNGALGGNIYQKGKIDYPVLNLIQSVRDIENSEITDEYIRFWNGYILILKILLSFTDLSGIRQLNIILEIILTYYLFSLLVKKRLNYLVLPLIISFLFLEPLSLALCMAFSGFYYCTIISSILLIKFNDRLKKDNCYTYFFCLLGISTFFFNMNYFQLITFCVPLLIYYELNGYKKNIKDQVEDVVRLFICWLIGFFGMMVIKWIICFVTIDQHIFAEMYEKVIYRLSNKTSDESVSRVEAIYRNVKIALSNKIWLLIEAGYVIYGFRYISGSIFKKMKSFLTVIIVLGVMVLLRYLIFANHVIVHDWIMYRLLMIPILGIDIFFSKIKSEKI